MTRFYGTAFGKKAELEAYITMMEEAKKRDHRKLGKELGLFMMHEAGPGFPFFLPKGMALKNTLLDYWRRDPQKGRLCRNCHSDYFKQKLMGDFRTLGTLQKQYYTTVIDEEDYAVKPMNCPGGILVYASEPRSYKICRFV